MPKIFQNSPKNSINIGHISVECIGQKINKNHRIVVKHLEGNKNNSWDFIYYSKQ